MFYSLFNFSIVSTNHCGGLEPMLAPPPNKKQGSMFLPLSRASSVAKEVTLPGLQRLQSPLSVSFVSRLFALKAADMLWGGPMERVQGPGPHCWLSSADSSTHQLGVSHLKGPSSVPLTPEPRHPHAAWSNCRFMSKIGDYCCMKSLRLKVACNAANSQKILYS